MMKGADSVRSRLFDVLISYMQNKMDTRSFCCCMEDLFYPDVPFAELSAFEYEVFSKLAYACARFSPYESDIQQCPGAYHTAEEVKQLASETYDALKKRHCIR